MQKQDDDPQRSPEEGSKRASPQGGHEALRAYLLERWTEETNEKLLGARSTKYTAPNGSGLSNINVVSSNSSFCGKAFSCTAPGGKDLIFGEAEFDQAAFISNGKIRTAKEQKDFVEGKVEFELTFLKTQGNTYAAYAAQIKKSYGLEGPENVFRILEQSFPRKEHMLAAMHYSNDNGVLITSYFPKAPTPNFRNKEEVEKYRIDLVDAARDFSDTYAAQDLNQKVGGTNALNMLVLRRTGKLTSDAKDLFDTVSRKYFDQIVSFFRLDGVLK